MDPYHHHIVIHTYPQEQDKVYPSLLGARRLTGVSLQNDWNVVHARTLKWIEESAQAKGHRGSWPMMNKGRRVGVPPDGFSGLRRQGRIARDAAVHAARHAPHHALGQPDGRGAGVEYYFGYKLAQNDLAAEDFRSRDRSWDYCRIALQFFQQNQIPFWEMKNADALVGNEQHDNSRYCFAKPGELYLVYLPLGGTTSLDQPGVGSIHRRLVRPAHRRPAQDWHCRDSHRRWRGCARRAARHSVGGLAGGRATILMAAGRWSTKGDGQWSTRPWPMALRP